MQKKVSSRIAILSLLAGATAIATAPILVRLSEIGPISTAFWRVLISWPILLTALLSRKNPPDVRREKGDLKLLILPGLFFAGDLGNWHWSIRLTSIANSSLLVNLAPVFVTLGAWWIFRKRVTRTFLVGLALALLGTFLLVGDTFSVRRNQVTGDLLAVLAAVFYGSYLLSIKQARHKFTVVRILTWTTFCCGLGLLPAALFSGEVFLPRTAQTWGALVAMALLCQIAGQGLITFGMAHLPASFSSVTLLLQPSVAALFAWVLFKESIGLLQGMGGIVMLMGIVIARRGTKLDDD